MKPALRWSDWTSATCVLHSSPHTPGSHGVVVTPYAVVTWSTGAESAPADHEVEPADSQTTGAQPAVAASSNNW